jgi:hypothetical protein
MFTPSSPSEPLPQPVLRPRLSVMIPPLLFVQCSFLRYPTQGNVNTSYLLYPRLVCVVITRATSKAIITCLSSVKYLVLCIPQNVNAIASRWETYTLPPSLKAAPFWLSVIDRQCCGFSCMFSRAVQKFSPPLQRVRHRICCCEASGP